MADIQNAAPRAVTPPSGRALVLREFWANFSRNKGAVGAGVIVLALIVVAIFAPLIAPHSPIEQYRDFVKIPPAWLDGGNWKFILGTDEAGRDILSRLMYGARLSLLIGLGTSLLSGVVGAAVGMAAAQVRRLDAPLMRLMDALMA